MAADLLTLAARVEALTGPDREVDAEIMFDLFAKPVGRKEDGGPSGYLWPKDNPSWSFGIRFPGKDRNWFASCRRHGKETLLIERDGALVLMNDLRIPPLTASIDAVMALIQENLPAVACTVSLQPVDTLRGYAWVQIEGHLIQSWAATPALALLAAFLRALAKDAP